MATFAERLMTAKNMVAGLTAHAPDLTSRGITKEVLDQMNQLYERAIELDDKRNALKARSQEATSETEETMSELESLCSDAKKIVRMELPEESWPEFGFRKGEYAAKKVVVQSNQKA